MVPSLITTKLCNTAGNNDKVGDKNSEVDTTTDEVDDDNDKKLR